MMYTAVTGNMVLYDSKDKFVWESFASPTDTLLVGQFLPAGNGGPTSLISRASPSKNVNGKYSLQLDSKNQRLSLYRNKKLVQVLIRMNEGTPEYVRFDSDKRNNDLIWVYQVSSLKVIRSISRPGFNTTLTYLRLGIDGNLKAFTYDTRTEAGSWKETYALFQNHGKVLTF